MSLSLVFCLVPLVCPQAPTPVAESLPLQQLLAPHASQPVPPWRTLLQHPDGTAHPDLLHGADGMPGLPIDEVLGMLTELHRAACDAGTLHFAPQGNGVMVLGSDNEVAKVKERVRGATATMARAVQVEFAVWDGADRETPPAFLGPADYTRFAANRAPLWRGVAVTRHGHAVAIDRMRWTRYARSVDANVAQKQTALAPSVDRFGEGGHAIVRPFALAGGDEWAVHVQFAVAQRRGTVRTLQLSLPAVAEIDLPTLETCYGTCSGRIQNGGALAATLRGHAATGGHHILTVRVIARVSPPAAVQDGLAILPCGALTSTGLDESGADDDGFVGVSRGLDHGHVPNDALLELLRLGLGAEAEQCSLQCGAGFVFARGPAGALNRLEAMLKSIQDRLLRNATVAQLGQLEAVDNPPAGWSATLHELVLPTLHGRALTANRCLEMNCIVGHSSYLAQEATTLGPLVERLQSGTLLVARTSPIDDAVYLQLQACHRFTIAPPARTIATSGATLMLGEVARTSSCHDGTVANGQAIEHGDGPTVTIDGRGYRSAIATTVRW